VWIQKFRKTNLACFPFTFACRTGPPDWPGGDEAWKAFRAKEPVNAHSHIIAMLLGTSESIPVTKGLMRIGTYQNIIVVN
jgi:hypothetical protein